MESGPMSVDGAALDPPALPDDGANEPKYGGHSRFELELEVRPPLRPPFSHPGS
jgi:mediator of RNA polymerase II transcription subunit 31